MIDLTSRLKSLLKTETIGILAPNVITFELKELENISITNYPDLPSLRLGKYIEKLFSLLIKSSSNYTVLKENIQIIDNKTTIGEFDFIIQHKNTKQISHLELVYKFYLYDPNNSSNELNKWIGPNRKDSFNEKFEKLKLKQFPLLYNPKTVSYLQGVDIDLIHQKLCFMASLFVPLSMLNKKIKFINNKAIVGYWLTSNEFLEKNHSCNQYYLPEKSEWGIEPQYNSNWYSFSDIELALYKSIERQFSPLCWIKTSKTGFEQCFIVWW